MKSTGNKPSGARLPRQERAQHKVELILEAAMRLLAKGGFAALTTNAVAETAGVSIGTLYQYFSNKEAILDALAEREMAQLSQGVLNVLKTRDIMPPIERVARVVRVVTSSYGGRHQVHRLVMEHSFRRGGARLEPLIQQIVAFLASDGPLAGDGRASPLTHAEAFVLTNAFVGVMRAMISQQALATLPQEEIEEALGRLIVTFAGHEAGQ